MGNWTIRRAEPDDADALSVCIDAAYAQYAERITDLPTVSANCAQKIAKNQVWVADIENELVGGLVMAPQDDFMLLDNVVVHPDQRGTGLGRAFMALAETESFDQGYRELRLSTHVDMPENVQFYKRLGWKEDQRHGNRVSMKKAI